jgi:hypothetical protein
VRMKTNAATVTCPKCNGSRKLPHYASIANGDCFECGATGRVAAGKASKSTRTPAADPCPEVAIARLRCFYASARENGACWFENADETGLGMPTVRYYASLLDATTAAKVLAAFEVLAA